MQLHLVGGFLGSGKTTAIIAAAKQLMRHGQRVAVVTNDQGKYLVDTAFFTQQAVPAVQVTGGCFCCNYTGLEERLDQLRSEVNPDVIFAESVGSCGDLVATVMEPLRQLRGDLPPSSFSVFTDARLLSMRLRGEDLPFSENVVYIFDKQIEEAPLLMINKTDLLAPEEAAELEALARQRYPEKRVRLVSTLDAAQVGGWLAGIQAGEGSEAPQRIEMDYERYGAGEARLAWLDEEVYLRVPAGSVREAAALVITTIQAAIREKGAAIGHVKFLVSAGNARVKVSLPTLDQPGDLAGLSEVTVCEGTLLINARVEMEPDQLRDLVRAAVAAATEKAGADGYVRKIDSFRPGYPNPTHRFTA
jgi:Ni2+-binding GTPase involved in maturation of urease and hydrogenase